MWCWIQMEHPDMAVSDDDAITPKIVASLLSLSEQRVLKSPAFQFRVRHPDSRLKIITMGELHEIVQQCIRSADIAVEPWMTATAPIFIDLSVVAKRFKLSPAEVRRSYIKPGKLQPIPLQGPLGIRRVVYLKAIVDELVKTKNVR